MTDKIFGPIVTDDEIKIEFRKRSSNLNFLTIKASKFSLVLEKVKIEELEGWERFKRNKKSYKLSRKKPIDEQLEDELWCIFANMGFPILSSGRNFCIETKKDPNPRQIDVFAKDDEVALVIECTQCTKPTTSIRANIDKLITKVSKFKNTVSKEITAQYRASGKVKQKFIIATRNIDWGEADISKCKAENIEILTDNEIDYYKGLTTHLKSAARFQFLAHIFEGTEIPGLERTVPATKGILGNTSFFTFLIEPMELLKISYVGQKSSRSLKILETYQRLLQTPRLRAIASYINKGGKFPTNIVINFKLPRNRKLVFESRTQFGDTATGNLKLPSIYGAAWIIDGQHRLYGYAYRNLTNAPKEDKTVLPVLAFENLPAEKEMQMFIDINSKQVKVKTSLLFEIYANLHWNSDNPAERFLALQGRIVEELNARKTSPICDRIVITGKSKTTFRCLTATTLADGIKQSRLLGSIKQEVFSPGPMCHHNPKEMEKSLNKCVGAISEILNEFAKSMPEHWQAGDKQSVGYLCTNIGIRSILLVIMDICSFISTEKGSNLSNWTKDEIVSEVNKYIKYVVEYFSIASIEHIQSFRKIGSSLASVKSQSMEMNIIIHEKLPEYMVYGLDSYISTRDRESTNKCGRLIDEIETILFQHVISKLKSVYNNGQEWWFKIPEAIRIAAGRRYEEDKYLKEKEQYLFFIDFQDIARVNWDLFDSVFALDEKDRGHKVKCLEWVKKINDIRMITHHTIKGTLTQEQVNYANEIHIKVSEYFLKKIGN